jgi:hypothetical protein
VDTAGRGTPRWGDFKVFAQMRSSFRLMLDVDWSSLFKSFYEKVRVKIACRNPCKIPLERLFELDKKLYLVSILVEGFEQEDDSRSGKGDDGDQGDDEDGAQDDDFDDLDDEQDMETDKSVQNTNNFTTPQGKQIAGSKTKTVSGPLVDMSLEGMEKQRPQEVAHMYVDSAKAGDPSDDWDNEQKVRWEKFLNLADKHMSWGDVLQVVELIEVDMKGTKDQTH